ncbi:MAG: hypothetical protein ACC653_08665 [Gammaproteobacteria bacterium]
MTSHDEFRKSVIEVLELLSSKQQQLDFQQKSPSANVALELMCRWFSDLYNLESHLLKRSFSDNEQIALLEFNRYYDTRKRSIPESIEILHQDSDWAIIMTAAKKLLVEIKSNN